MCRPGVVPCEHRTCRPAKCSITPLHLRLARRRTKPYPIGTERVVRPTQSPQAQAQWPDGTAVNEGTTHVSITPASTMDHFVHDRRDPVAGVSHLCVGRCRGARSCGPAHVPLLGDGVCPDCLSGRSAGSHRAQVSGRAPRLRPSTFSPLSVRPAGAAVVAAVVAAPGSRWRCIGWARDPAHPAQREPRHSSSLAPDRPPCRQSDCRCSMLRPA